MRSLKLLFCSICVYLFSTQLTYSQAFVYTVDGKMYFTEAKDFNKDRITVEIGQDITKLIPKSEIVLIEFLEDEGMDILQKDKIVHVDPPKYNGDLQSFIAKGKRVYIPVSSTKVANRWGGKILRELLINDGYWKLVGCEEEADFILRYSFSDKGHDNARLIIYDRMDNVIAKSPSVDASYLWASRAGVKSGEKLYKRYIKKGIEKGGYKNWK